MNSSYINPSLLDSIESTVQVPRALGYEELYSKNNSLEKELKELKDVLRLIEKDKIFEEEPWVQNPRSESEFRVHEGLYPIGYSYPSIEELEDETVKSKAGSFEIVID